MKQLQYKSLNCSLLGLSPSHYKLSLEIVTNLKFKLSKINKIRLKYSRCFQMPSKLSKKSVC